MRVFFVTGARFFDRLRMSGERYGDCHVAPTQSGLLATTEEKRGEDAYLRLPPKAIKTK